MRWFNPVVLWRRLSWRAAHSRLTLQRSLGPAPARRPSKRDADAYNRASRRSGHLSKGMLTTWQELARTGWRRSPLSPRTARGREEAMRRRQARGRTFRLTCSLARRGERAMQARAGEDRHPIPTLPVPFVAPSAGLGSRAMCTRTACSGSRGPPFSGTACASARGVRLVSHWRRNVNGNVRQYGATHRSCVR
jgi:hypothetical protein